MGRSDWLVVAVAGATCSGKSTLAKSLSSLFPGSVLLHQDDFFYDVKSDKHTIIEQLNHINFEILSSLDCDSFFDRILSIINGPEPKSLTDLEIKSSFPKFIPSGEAQRQFKNLLFLDGFLLLNEPRIDKISDLKFFVTIDEASCWNRRSARIYGPPDPPGYFQLCVWPSYETHFQQVRDSSEGVVYLDGTKTQEENLQNALRSLELFFVK